MEEVTLSNVMTVPITSVKWHIMFNTNIPHLNHTWVDDHSDDELRMHCLAAIEYEVYGSVESLHRRRLRAGWYERYVL